MISPGPTPTRSTATSALPVSAPAVVIGWIHWRVTPDSVSCLTVETTRPMTRAICTRGNIGRQGGAATDGSRPPAQLLPYAASIRHQGPPRHERTILEQLHEQDARDESAHVRPDRHASGHFRVCLLYTSDAADERSSVDLGGRR